MSDSLFCSIRKRRIKASPEERVRQSLLNYLILELGYPSHQILIEKNINCLPFYKDPLIRPPCRRLDILILAKDFYKNPPFFPLVLIECKATQVNQKAIRQVLGYNYFLKACFVALASPQSLQYGWLDSHQKFHLKSGFPSYLMLLEKAKILDLY